MDTVWTILTSVGASLLTFLVTTIFYQSNREKKQEKIAVFKTLMATRGIRDYEAVKALNSIDVVFSDCKSVLTAWHRFQKSLVFEGQSTPEKEDEIYVSETKMFEAMAKNLGYRNITWDILDKQYCPRWLSDAQRAQAKQNKNILYNYDPQNQFEKQEVSINE